MGGGYTYEKYKRERNMMMETATGFEDGEAPGTPEWNSRSWEEPPEGSQT